MKKMLGFTLVLTTIFGVSCSSSESSGQTAEQSEEPVAEEEVVEEVVTEEVTDVEPINVATLTGPTGMGMAKLMHDDALDVTVNDYNFEVLSGVDEIAPKVVQGEVDVITVPANLASVLYNKTEGGVSVLAVNTLGVLYILDKDGSIQSVADLEDKTIYSSGYGATPEYVLNYVLEGNGLVPGENVTVEYKSEQAEVVATITGLDDGVAMLPEPFATTAKMKDESLRTALDLTEEWDKLQEGAENPSSLITGVVIARNEFIEENPEGVETFMSEYMESINFTNENVEEASTIIEEQGIFKAAVAKQAIPLCNIVYIDGEEMENSLSGYLQVLYDQNPASVGGTLPSEDFYYAKK
ncbi:MAG: ABC transporter substrate-binding protein [Lachnospirales bacterium]